MKSISAIVLLVLFFCSCGLLKKDNALKIEEPSVVLVGTNWFLTSLNNQAIEIDALQPIKIKINADNTFKGFAGCNQFWGICKTMQTQINFSNINRTKMSCAKIKIENELTDILRTAQGFLINGNKLQLINKNAEIIAVFQSNIHEGK